MTPAARHEAGPPAKGGSAPLSGRIVVAIDERRGSEGVLVVATRLAAGLGARLTGLFVEDSRLLDLARAEGTRQIGSFTGRERPLATGELRRSLELRAGAVQHALAGAAERSGVPWSFRVARGPVDRELLTVCVPGDLLVLGRGASRRRLGSSARRLVENATVPLLVLGEDLEDGPSASPAMRLVLIHDAPDVDEAAIVATSRLAARLSGSLEVLLEAGREALAERLRGLLSERRMPGRVRLVSRLDVETLFDELPPSRRDLLVVAAGGALGRPESRVRLLARARGPVLFLAEGTASGS